MATTSTLTHSARPSDIQKSWLLIDADGLVLGRLASIVANRLRGKHKPTYTPHMDDGDYVIIVNAEKVQLTGRKRGNKIHYRHTGYPGGIKTKTPEHILASSRPEKLIHQAVRRMIPRGPLGRLQLSNLRLYCGPDHPHEAQKPAPLDVASMNPKNRARP
jgi:large subunit ribosomal protein L13